MKPNRQNRFRRFGAINLLAGSVLIALMGQQARAATYNWDPLVPPAPAIGGTGTWDATSATTNWTLGVPDGLVAGNIAWAQGNAANFTNLSGVVTLANSPQVTGLSVAAGGGVLTGSTLVVTGAGATISNAGAGGLTIASNINGLAATQPLALQGTGSNINVSGSIQGNIGAVTTSGLIALSGTNAFTGALNVTGGTTNLNNASAITSANNLSISGGATVNVNASEAAGTLTGTAGTTLNLNGATLTVNESGTGSIFAGALGGGAGGLILNGTSAAPLTLSGTSTTYTGQNTVNSGALLVVTATNALGIAGASTVVNTGATVTLSGGISEASAFTLNGTGVTSGFPGASATTTGSLVNVSGTNTVSGAITTPGAAGTTIYAEGGSTLNLTGGITAATGAIGNSVTFQTGVSSSLASSTATVNVPSVIGLNIDQVIKTGPGNLNLSGNGAGNTYYSFPASLGGNVIQTVIQAGTITINADNQLGAPVWPAFASTALNGVQFNGAAGATGANIPTLAVTGNVNFEQNGGGGRYFTVTSALGQFNVSSGTTSTIANGQLVFGSTTNTLNQIGSGTLVIDTTNAITGNTSVAPVGTGTTSTIGGVLDVSSGGAATPIISVWGAVTGSASSTPTGPGGYPTSGTTVLVVDGLGDATGGNANGTINLGVAGHAFDSVVLNLSNQTSGLTFAGTLNTQGDLDVRNLSGTTAYNPVTNSYINPLTLSGTNTINGNVNISGAQLIVTSSGALGDSLPLSYNHATIVNGLNTTDNTNPAGPTGITPGQSAISPGILSLTGGITLNEHITLVNNGRLDNLSGNNTITAPVGVTLNSALPYTTISGSTNGQIGATAGTLTLQNGIFGDPNSVTLNGLNTDTGKVVVAGAIQATVWDVALGNIANTTNTVQLDGTNTYAGPNTILNGGNVLVGNNAAFSGSTVLVNAPTTLDADTTGIALANPVTLNQTLTVGNVQNVNVPVATNGSLILSGTISGNSGITKIGTGTLTIGGTDTYFGTTLVQAGTLVVSGSLNSGLVSVALNAALQTTGAEKLADGSTLDANGTVTLGGNETIKTLTGAATGTVAIGGNTLTLQDGNFSGNLSGTGGSLVKNGGGTLNLSGNNSALTGTTTVNNGVLNAANLGSVTVQVNTGGTLTATGTFAATNINVASGATLNANTLLATTATVNDSGVFNITSGPNTIANLNVNAASGLVILAGGNLTIAPNISVPGSGSLNGGGSISLGANTLTASSGYYNGLIYGNGNVTMAGPGTLTLAGANAFTGAANVTGGTLIAQTPLAATALNVSSGATYLNVGGLQNPNVVITNAGTTTLYGNQVASSYTSNSGTLNGTGLLTAASYTLNGTSTVGNPAAFGLVSIGTGVLTSTGTVGLYANSAANTINVTGGTLSAAGNLGSPNAAVGISPGATLYMLLNPSLGYNGLIANTATVTNAGTLELSQNQTINAYISNGGLLMGNGNTPVPVLTAATYAQNNGSVLAATAGLGTGALTSNGAVTLNGNSLANSVAVQTGTLTVNAGLGSPNATVGISTGATLKDNGNIVDTAAVTNAGTLTLGFTPTTGDTIGSYVSTGTLNGTGTLTAATYALNGGSLLTGNANLGKGILTTNGAVTIAGASSVNAGTITVQSGTLSLTGTGTFGGDLTVTINSGATLVDNGTINSTADPLTNMGTLTLNGSNQTVTSYVSGDASGPGTVGDGLLNGSGAGTPYTLSAATYALNNNSVVAATAGLGTGALTSNGTVHLNGTSAAGTVLIASGDLFLGSANLLADNAAVTNEAILTLGGNDTVGSYTSTGNLNGAGTLTAATYNLNGGSVVSLGANLGGGTLNSNGSVLLHGNSAANTVNVQTGTLTSTGSLGVAGSQVTVSGGATLASTGTLTYGFLQGNGTVQKALLTNTTTVNPGIGTGATGTLTVAGNYTEQGTLQIDLARSGAGAVLSDQLAVTGQVTLTPLGTTLKLQQVGGFEMARTESAQVIHAVDGITGTIGTFDITQFTNEMLFDNTSGIVYGVGIQQGQTLGQLPGLTQNASNIGNALGGNPNIPSLVNAILPGNIVDGTTPMGATLLAVLAAPSAQMAFNELSPESYAGFIDYGLHVTQAYSRAAMDMPENASYSTSGGSKGGASVSVSNDTSVFVGYNHYSVGSSSSYDGAEYGFNSDGGLVGVRHKFGSDIVVGAYAGGDRGSISSDYLHATSDGYVFGLLGTYTAEQQHMIQVIGSATYAGYSMSGTRSTLTGPSAFNGGDDKTLDLHLGVQGKAYCDDKLTVTPTLGLDYLTSKMNAIHENTANPSALSVAGVNVNSLLGEVGVNFEYKVVSPFAIVGGVGYSHDFDKTSRTLNASFANGNPADSFSVVAPGMGRDIYSVGLGGVYSVTDSISIGLHYRADYGSKSKMANSVMLGSSFGF